MNMNLICQCLVTPTIFSVTSNRKDSKRVPPKGKPFRNMVSPLETPSSSPNHCGGMKPDRKCSVILFCLYLLFCKFTPIHSKEQNQICIWSLSFGGCNLLNRRSRVIFKRETESLLNGILFRSFSVADDRKRTFS